jgi:hypothetical protein
MGTDYLKRIAVHIGPGKTGTSSLQTSFTRNSSFLANKGFLYPTFWGPNGVVRKNSLASWTTQLRDALSSSAAHTLLISSEFLQTASHEIAELASLFEVPRESVKVFTTVRDHESHYISHLHQFVKQHHDVSQVTPTQWKSFIPPWAARFPVTYVPYVDSESEINLVERLWRAMCDQSPPTKTPWKNRSPTAEESYLLQEFHRRNFSGQPRQFRPETKVYQKALLSLKKSRSEFAHSRHTNLRPPWPSVVQEFTRDDQDFLADRGVMYKHPIDPINYERSANARAPAWEGPKGIEEILEVNFEKAEAMRQKLKRRLKRKPGFRNLIL